jgi:membrane-associated phospholipid phosphatase
MATLIVGVAALYLCSLRSPERWGGSWKAKARIGLIVLALVLLVGLGRVYMGAHYPSDVLAGWTLGGVCASPCLTAAEVFRKLRQIKAKGGTGDWQYPPGDDSFLPCFKPFCSPS